MRDVGTTSSDPTRAACSSACAELEPPFACVDLDAFEENRAALVRRAGGKAIRVAQQIAALPGAARAAAGGRGRSLSGASSR